MKYMDRWTRGPDTGALHYDCDTIAVHVNAISAQTFI